MLSVFALKLNHCPLHTYTPTQTPSAKRERKMCVRTANTRECNTVRRWETKGKVTQRPIRGKTHLEKDKRTRECLLFRIPKTIWFDWMQHFTWLHSILLINHVFTFIVCSKLWVVVGTCSAIRQPASHIFRLNWTRRPVDIQVYKNVIKQFMIDYLQKTKRNSLTHVHRLS